MTESHKNVHTILVDDKCTDVSLEPTMKNVVGQRDPYPKRARKPNPKYDSETYDLSTDD